MSEALTVRRALAQSGLVPVDASVLLAHALGVDRAWLAAHATDVVPEQAAQAFLELARRRRDGEPVAYLTGSREFWGLRIEVTPDVLIPRPETETLVEQALARLPADRPLRVLDLGTGSGAIALAIAHERPQARVLATDSSAKAIAVARRNVARLALANVDLAQGDWYRAVHGAARFDLIASNPPYVAPGDPHLESGDLVFEPSAALTTGTTGLSALATIVAGAPAHLLPGGWLLVEHGYDQADDVRSLLAEAGFATLARYRDLAGIPRVAAGRIVLGV